MKFAYIRTALTYVNNSGIVITDTFDQIFLDYFYFYIHLKQTLSKGNHNVHAPTLVFCVNHNTSSEIMKMNGRAVE